MGVKSTQTLTRQQAEALYWELYDKLTPRVVNMHDSTLEDALERLNDLVNGGEGREGFANYRIVK